METLDIVSLTGMALSIFCYIGTIVTYASFHELRNIPGMCLINVSVALLIPTVSFVVTLCVVISGTPCVALAILQQLCLLAAFSWMSLQAVHMVRTFVLTNWQTPMGHPQNRKQWARVSLTHALMGWGFPTIYTAVLLFFHFCHDCLPGGAQFRFGKGVNSTSSECWPGQTYLANHLSIDPLLILLTFNIMALLNVMIAIIRQRMVTRKVAGRELRKEMAVNLLILTKVNHSANFQRRQYFIISHYKLTIISSRTFF